MYFTPSSIFVTAPIIFHASGSCLEKVNEGETLQRAKLMDSNLNANWAQECYLLGP